MFSNYSLVLNKNKTLIRFFFRVRPVITSALVKSKGESVESHSRSMGCGQMRLLLLINNCDGQRCGRSNQMDKILVGELVRGQIKPIK